MCLFVLNSKIPIKSINKTTNSCNRLCIQSKNQPVQKRFSHHSPQVINSSAARTKAFWLKGQQKFDREQQKKGLKGVRHGGPLCKVTCFCNWKSLTLFKHQSAGSPFNLHMLILAVKRLKLILPVVTIQSTFFPEKGISSTRNLYPGRPGENRATISFPWTMVIRV